MSALKIAAVITGLFSLFITQALAQDATSIEITPATQTVNLTTEATVTVTITNVTDMGAYQFAVNFDPSKATVKSAAIGSFLGSTGRTAVPVGPTIDNTTGKVTLGAFSFGAGTGPNGNGTLATIVFNTVGLGAAPLTLANVSLTNTANSPLGFTTQNSTITVDALAPSPTPTTAITSSPTPTASPTPTVTTTPNPTPSSTPSAGTTMWLTTPTTTIINNPTTTDLMFSTDTAVSGIDVFIRYNPAAVTIDSITDNHLFPVTPLMDFNNGSGLIKLSQLINPGTPYTGQGSVATIHFTPIAGSSTSFTFDFVQGSKADTNAISLATSADILTAPSPLSLTIVNPADLTLSLTTPSENTETGFSVTGQLTDPASDLNIQVNTDASGSSGPLRLPNAFIGQLKNLYFKVSGFLREKITLTVNPGNNPVDLGLLKAGDLDNNGTINALDLTLMYGQWFQAGNADFNQDGIVNSADHWHLIQNFLLTDE